MLDGKSILVTGGTGSFGKQFAQHVLENYDPERLIIFSRDELKQFEMMNSPAFQGKNKDRLRFFIGDVRDKSRLDRAFDGVDLVVHAAALKQVPACEYNPFEAIRTNVLGAQNIIEAAIDRNVQRVIAMSTDKACNPINLYGGTKLCSDKLFVAGNSYAGSHATRFSVVRYGNVVGSRGSVIPLFMRLRESGVLPITHLGMTRFWLTLEQGVEFVVNSFGRMQGGELFVRKNPSMKIVDLAKAIGGEEIELKEVGIRPGEKLHEVMISEDDARHTVEFPDYYVIQPEFPWWGAEDSSGDPVAEGFCYSSDNNTDWLTKDDLADMVPGIKD